MPLCHRSNGIGRTTDGFTSVVRKTQTIKIGSSSARSRPQSHPHLRGLSLPALKALYADFTRWRATGVVPWWLSVECGPGERPGRAGDVLPRGRVVSPTDYPHPYWFVYHRYLEVPFSAFISKSIENDGGKSRAGAPPNERSFATMPPHPLASPPVLVERGVEFD